MKTNAPIVFDVPFVLSTSVEFHMNTHLCFNNELIKFWVNQFHVKEGVFVGKKLHDMFAFNKQPINQKLGIMVIQRSTGRLRQGAGQS